MTDQDLLDLHERVSALAALVARAEGRLEALEAQHHSDKVLILAALITSLSVPWQAAVGIVIDTMIETMRAEKGASGREGGSGAADRETP